MSNYLNLSGLDRYDTNIKKYIDDFIDDSEEKMKRIYSSLIPTGIDLTEENLDLNTIDFLKIGNYYCRNSNRVKTFLNCPVKVSFRMEVQSPLYDDNETIATYAYRIRKLISFDGQQYIQFVKSGSTAGVFTYGEWEKILTDKSSIKDAQLAFGGPNIANGVTPIDMAMSDSHCANRIAFAKPEGIAVEYSTDGETFLDYEATDIQKNSLVSGIGYSFQVGKGEYTLDSKLRITFTAKSMGVYFNLNKILIYISSGGAKTCYAKIEISKVGDVDNFTEYGVFQISGDSGWNSIPFIASNANLTNTRFGYGNENQVNQIAVIRFTFYSTELFGSSYTNNLRINKIQMYGDTCWAANSELAKNNRVYTISATQNVTFPNGVYASSFNGNLVGNFAGISSSGYQKAVAKYYSGDSTAPDTAIEPNILSYIGKDGYYFVDTKFFAGQTSSSNRCQVAYGYEKDRIYFRRYYNGWKEWKELAFNDVATSTSNGLMSSDNYKTLSSINNYVNSAITTPTSTSVSSSIGLVGGRGISMIQVVSALPANPNPNILYIVK